MKNRPLSVDTLAAWESGLTLGEASWEFAFDYEKRKYRKARTRGAIESLELLMRANLVGDIYAGKFVCFGLNSEPSINRVPEKIDRLLFCDLNKQGMLKKYIDWNESSLNYAGRQYTAIRVIRASNSEKVEKADPPKRIGRPSIDQQLKSIVSSQKKRGHLKGKIGKEREHIIREAARAKYPDLFPRPTQPSRQKILQALKSAGISEKSW